MAMSQLQEETTDLEELSNNAFRSFFENFVANFQHGAEETISSLGYFLGELQIHLTGMQEISGEIAKVDSHYGMRLWTLVKDVSSLRDYYHIIYNSTKGVVEYGTSNIILEIQTLIREKRYHEATEIMESFLNNLKDRIKMVENDIEKMKQDYSVDWKDIQEKIENIHDDYDAAKDQLDTKVRHAQAKQTELLKLGTSSFFYVALGTAAGGMLVSIMPDTNVGAVMKQITEQVGTEIITFSFGNVLKGLHSLASHVPSDLQKKVESNASKVRDCLNGFFKIMTSFHMKIATVISGIDKLRVYNNKLQEKLVSKSISQKNIADWQDISTYLQQIYRSLVYLQDEVIEKETFKISEIDEAMRRLINGIEVTSAGTPV